MFLLSFALLSTLIIFSLSVFYFVNRTENEAWRGRQSEAARNAAGVVSNFIQRVEDSLIILSIVEPDHHVEEPDELLALIDQNPSLLEVIRTDDTGLIIAEVNRDNSVLANLITIPQSQWFLQAKVGKIYISNIQISAKNEPYLIMAVPSAEGGVVAARVEMSVLWDVVKNIQFGEAGRAYVITRKGQIIAHTNAEIVLNNTSIQDRPEFINLMSEPESEWFGTFKSFDGETVVGRASPIEGTEWLIMTELPRTEAFGSTRRAIFVLGAEALILLLLTSWLMARRIKIQIMEPMESLQKGTEEIGLGNLNYRTEMNRHDEIGQLSAAFDKMAVNLLKQKEELVKQTKSLQDSEANLRRITDNMFDVITEIGPDGIILYASPSHKWVLGINPNTLIGKFIFEGLHPDDMAEGLSIFSQAVAEGVKPDSFILRYKHANEEYLWMECVSSILRDDKGEFSGAILSSRDVSRRKRMEMELSASEQRYRMLAENASDVIWVADMNLQMTYISPAVKKLRGYSVEEALSQSIPQSLAPKSAENALQYFAQILMELETGPIKPLKGASRNLELEMNKKDGSTVWTETRVSFLLDKQDEPVGVLGVSRDITERKQMEESRQKALEYEIESKRARELAILLKSSEATSSSLDLETILLTLATQMLELSGYQSCFISEWDKETNKVFGLAQHSRILWTEEKRDAFSLSEYPNSKEVLLTGKPMIIQGGFESEEIQWMNELGRTALIMLPLCAHGTTIALVEIASTKKDQIFNEQVISDCLAILSEAEPLLIEPLFANDPNVLFAIEERLLKASRAEICSFSEWDRAGNRVFTHTVSADIVWSPGQGPSSDPLQEVSWKLALQEGQSSVIVGPDEEMTISSMQASDQKIGIEALIVFPLQKGNERIGMIELFDFNFKTHVSPEQLTLMRTIADKASYSIENARLLNQTQRRLKEQTTLLDEKEILLKEIHHRVKNNLQIISSLLNLQTRGIEDSDTLQNLRDSQTRIRSMALIHEKLYQSPSLASIDFGEYVKSLAFDLFQTYRGQSSGIQLEIKADEVLISLDQAVSCGLILNELMTNALKYAFPHGRSGTIWVELQTTAQQILMLRVTDDGVGLPPDFDIFHSKSLGLQLVNNLARQLNAEIEVADSSGTSFSISFKYRNGDL